MKRMDQFATQNNSSCNSTMTNSRIILDMEAISLLTKNNWLFSRFDIDERVYIFHWPETGEKCMLYVVGNDDMFISADEMEQKIPSLKDEIHNITFTQMSSSTLPISNSLEKYEMVISHPDDIEHDLFFIVLSTLNYLNGDAGLKFTQLDNTSDAIYDLKRFTVEKIDRYGDEVDRFSKFWQSISPFIEIFMTRATSISMQNQMLSLLEDQDEHSTFAMHTSLYNILLAMSEKVCGKIDSPEISVGDCNMLCSTIIDKMKKMRFFREIASECSKEHIQQSSSYYQKLKDPANYPIPNKKAMEVYFIACKEDTDYGELVDAIKEDPALTAKILKMLNTPMFRTLNSISTISIEALSMFGLPRIKEMSLNVAIDFRDYEIKCAAFDYNIFYQESLACAIAARNLTSYINKTSPEKNLFTPDQAYTVGLLSQVGKLAFAAVCPQPYNLMLNDCGKNDGKKLCDLEKKDFGIDHCEIAADMLSEWQFSESFCKAIRYQYQYPENQTIFKDDVVASALASKLKAAGFMLKWSRNISSTITEVGNSSKAEVVEALSEGATNYDICPGNYHKQAVQAQKEWKTIKSVLAD